MYMVGAKCWVEALDRVLGTRSLVDSQVAFR
jgi:hypothetical protein